MRLGKLPADYLALCSVGAKSDVAKKSRTNSRYPYVSHAPFSTHAFLVAIHRGYRSSWRRQSSDKQVIACLIARSLGACIPCSSECTAIVHFCRKNALWQCIETRLLVFRSRANSPHDASYITADQLHFAATRLSGGREKQGATTAARR